MSKRNPSARPHLPKVQSACQQCGRLFQHYQGKPRPFCGRACAGVAQAAKYANGRRRGNCLFCGAPFSTNPASRRVYCSLVCKQTDVSRKTAGQRSQLLRARRAATATSYAKRHGRHEHRIVAEQVLGRALLPGEIVHHIDGNRRNNAPGNLAVMTQGEHARLHFTKGRLCSIAGCGRKHAAKGYCEKHWRQWRKGTLRA